MDILSWKTLLILVGAYLIFKLYKFYRYIKLYLIPYDIHITLDEITDGSQELAFYVVFGSGFLKKKYFSTIGEMENQSPLDISDLQKMLTLTKVSTFKNGSESASQEYHYIQPKNPNGTRKFNVDFLTLEDNVIDNLRQSANQ